MKGFGYFIKPIRKKPLLLVILGVVTFLYCYMEYTFLMPIVFGISNLKTGNAFDSIMHLIQLVLNYIPSISPTIFVYLILSLVAFSMVAGLFLSGTLNILNSTLIDSDKQKGTFAEGIRKHYLKISWITFLTIVYSVLFTIFIIVVSIPSIVITSASITEKPELLTVAYILDFITIGVLFFSIMFFKIYISFWYPAAINYNKKLFAMGKRAADHSFWGVLIRFLGFDLLLLIFQMGLFYMNNVLARNNSIVSEFFSVVILLIVNWIFKTILLISIISYVFSKFLAYWNRPKSTAN